MTDKSETRILPFISGAQKLIATLVCIGMALTTGVGTYVAFKTGTDYRLTDVAQKQQLTEVAINSLKEKTESVPDHERRIVRLEGHADQTDATLQQVTTKVDVAVAILQRVEEKVDKLDTSKK